MFKMKNTTSMFKWVMVCLNIIVVILAYIFCRNSLAIWNISHIPYISVLSMSPEIICALFFILAAVIECSVIYPLRRKWKLFVLLVVTLFNVASLKSICRVGVPGGELAAKYDFAFLNQDWDWILAHKNDNKDNSDIRSNYINLAYAKKGSLCDFLFHRRGLSWAKLIGEGNDGLTPVFRCYIYNELGAYPEAEKELENISWALSTVSPVSKLIDSLKKGEKPLRFDNTNTMLMYLVKNNPKNRMAAQYFIANDLITRNMEFLFDDFKLAGFSKLPVHCQEAAVFKWLMGKQTLDGIPFGISNEVKQNYEKLMDDRRYHRFNKTHISFAFGNTYWYYLMFK